MAILFKQSTKPAPPNAALVQTPDLLAASDGLTAALDARSRVDAAIEKNATDRQAANDARAHAEAEVARIELDLALETDTATIATLESAADAARTAAQDAAKAFDRADRLQGALYARAQAEDAGITAAQQAFNAALGAYAHIANEALAAELHKAAQPLIAVLLRAHAVAASIGSLSPHSGVLADIRLPSTAPSQPAIIAGSRLDTGVDLAAEWRSDPSASAVAALMAPISLLRRRAASHRAFTPPPAPTKPYVAQNKIAAEYNKGVEEREAASPAPKPAPWVGHVHSFENSGFHSRNR